MFDTFKETILKDYPRLSPEATFTFSCHKGLSCFTQCCRNVNIVLTPYDVLRMKRRLGLQSGEFLEKYTLPPVFANEKLPVVLLKMRDDEQKTCPFVGAEGCSIYEDRPWPCRMFPLGMASSKTPDRSDGEEFCFLVEDGFPCSGTEKGKEWTVEEWRRDQGADLYEEKSESYKAITLHKYLREGKVLPPVKGDVFYLTCYDLDRFRRLIFESTFLKRFDVEEDVVERIKTDDEALLDFGIDWLRFSLFGESTLQINGELAERKKKELGLDPVREEG